MVLDARDPLGCRPTEVEQYIQQKDPNKRIILVLNKIDLVPKVRIYMKYLANA
jgi:nuclear GTP-binding protein